MKLRLFLSALLVCLASVSYAETTLSPSMEKAISACVNLSAAINNGSKTPLSEANKLLKSAKIVNFGDIALVKGKELNVDGHFIFDEVFVDSLIVNRKVIDFASRYARNRSNRGSTGDPGQIKMTTRALKAGKSAIWKTVNRGDAEFAVVAEPGGLFTMTIRDADGKVLYTETKNNKQGESMRKARVKLSDNKRSTVLIEVINRGTSDASFAILKN